MASLSEAHARFRLVKGEEKMRMYALQKLGGRMPSAGWTPASKAHGYGRDRPLSRFFFCFARFALGRVQLVIALCTRVQRTSVH